MRQPGRSPWLMKELKYFTCMFFFSLFLEACDDPPRFKTMKLQGELKHNYYPGECVQYECRLGFKPKVPALPRSAVCQDNDTWSSLQEACVEKSCPNLGDPVNGQVNFVNGSVLFGSQAHFDCNLGFYLIGAKILYCEISGDNVDWSDNLPVCEVILCAAPGNITNGRFTHYKEVYQYGEVVMYRCNPSNGPDEYSLIGGTTLICVDHNRWSSDPPECKVVKCDYPIVQYGSIVSGFRGKYYYNVQVVFRCHDGFYLQGSNIIVCGANGTWEPELPKCTKGMKKWQPTPVFLPGESQGWGSLVGCHLWGRTESDMTEVT
uniref:Membrane cofactor protein n=1 Tax=Moschus moschiferus TaxID=68415 RepID=A0A8C6D6F4_MOSMO